MSGDRPIASANRRKLSESQLAAQELRAVAKPYRFRLRADAEGFPLHPRSVRPDRVLLRWRELPRLPATGPRCARRLHRPSPLPTLTLLWPLATRLKPMF